MTRCARVITLAGLLLTAPALVAMSWPSVNPGRAIAGASARVPVPVVVSDDHHDTSPPLRVMPLLAPESDGVSLAPAPGPLPDRDRPVLEAHQVDPVLQAAAGTDFLPAPLVSLNGLANSDGLLPPDPNGDIGYDPESGEKYYVQMVNVSFAVWDVTDNPTLIYGPARNNTLWQGFGGPCETTNNGDPIVLFDPMAHRWLMSQFSLPNRLAGPYYQCIAISQTPDPSGGWYRYAFKTSDTKMNDYAKFAVWPDAYYYSVNQFTNGQYWAGAGVAGFEREQMLAGLPARMVYFDLYGVDPHLGGLLPSDLDGTPPPSYEPDYFVTMDDDAWGYSPDQVQVWQFHVDWTDPVANSTFTRSAVLPAAAVDLSMCGSSRDCIPQPGTTEGLDAIAGQMMHRLQYRNFGAYQTLVGNVTADVDGSGHAGVRWFELRDSGAGWALYQQGTYAPDANHRWMGSIAMNGYGDIALGYSVSSSSVYPSVRVTGRRASSLPGLMTLGEGTLVAGGGSQTHSASRWGDYSMMAVDPVDDCTFWYTQEYYEVTSSASWRTRIGAFRLADCAPPPPLQRWYLPVILQNAAIYAAP